MTICSYSFHDYRWEFAFTLLCEIYMPQLKETTSPDRRFHPKISWQFGQMFHYSRRSMFLFSPMSCVQEVRKHRKTSRHQSTQWDCSNWQMGPIGVTYNPVVKFQPIANPPLRGVASEHTILVVVWWLHNFKQVVLNRAVRITCLDLFSKWL